MQFPRNTFNKIFAVKQYQCVLFIYTVVSTPSVFLTEIKTALPFSYNDAQLKLTAAQIPFKVKDVFLKGTPTRLIDLINLYYYRLIINVI